MSEIPADLKYTKSHEWVRDEGDGTIVIGITEHAQELLGDMVYIEVPEGGAELEQGEACAVVESVKAASDVYSPLTGECIEGNEALADSPELVNSDPYGEGWMFKMSAVEGLDGLLDADAYKAVVEAEDH